MTVLIDGRPLVDPRSGGVNRITRGYLPRLFSLMHQDQFILVTSGLKKPTLPFVLPNHVSHKHIFLPNKLWSAGSMMNALSLTHWFRKEKSDLLLLPNVGFIGTPHLPYALIVHDLSFLIEPAWFSHRGRVWHWAVHATRIIQHASVIFAASEGTKQDLIDRLTIDPTRISVIPFGLQPVGALLSPPPMLSNKRFVVCMGAGDPRKNSSCAVSAVETLRKNPAFKDVMLVVIGNASKAPTPSSSPFERGRILWLGRPSDAALNTLMKYASAFLYPSWYEGFGIPLHEAAQFGTPCISSTAHPLSHTAPQGTLFAPPSKPHLWTATLEQILLAPEKHKTQTTLGDWSKAAEIIGKVIHS